MKFFNFAKKNSQGTPAAASSNPDFEHMVEARAHGLMALWAAERMEKSCEEAAHYSDKIVEEDKPDAAFLEEINADLIAAEQHIEMKDLHERLNGFKVVAKLEFEDEDRMGGCS